MKFVLVIDSENDACQTKADIRYYLRSIANKLDKSDDAPILDWNGNTIGRWEFENEH